MQGMKGLGQRPIRVNKAVKRYSISYAKELILDLLGNDIYSNIVKVLGRKQRMSFVIWYLEKV